MLRSGFIILLIFGLLFSLARMSRDSSFPFLLPFCLIPIALTGFFYGTLWAGVVSSLFSIFSLALLYSGPLKSAPLLLMVLCFNSTPLVVHSFGRTMSQQKDVSLSRIQEATKSYEELAREDQAITQGNTRLEEQLLEMTRLYEITKAMSTTLKFGEVFAILSQVLQKVFRFTRCVLILVSQGEQNGRLQIEKLYEIKPPSSQEALHREVPFRLRIKPFDIEKKVPSEGTTGTGLGGELYWEKKDFEAKGMGVSKKDETLPTTKPTSFDKTVVDLFSEQKLKTHLYTKKAEENPFGECLPLAPQTESFLAFPLIVEQEVIGLLSAENLPEHEVERFLIVAGQFAIELEKVKLYRKVQELAIMDGLTKVFVRRHLLERFQEELNRSTRHKLKLSCLILDIDYFKDCNDRFGHLVGDVVLKELAEIMKDNIREVDLVGRYGGEEFCVVLPDTDRRGALHVGERLKVAVQNYIFKAYDETVKSTVSIGIATFPEDATNMEELIDKADQAMYKAKQSGRNRVYVYGEE